MSPRLRQWLIVSALLLIAGFLSSRNVIDIIAPLQARVLKPGKVLQVPWRTIDEWEVYSGATLPANTNVILKIPLEQDKIAREVLFGRLGRVTRYWGYCYPEDYRPIGPTPGTSFPGKVFLSEAERFVRAEIARRQQRTFSIFNPPTSEEIAARVRASETAIRHQIEIFRGGMTCYVMSEKPLPIGLDLDKDGLNAKLELNYGTSTSTFDVNEDGIADGADTDGDGVSDGKEIFGLKSLPLKRDTDGDGLIDGIEDKNQNGIRNFGETDPLRVDSDADGLCDGYCRIKAGRTCEEFGHTDSCTPTPMNLLYRGEDENLDGVIDPGETDPTKVDTDADGILDEQEFFDCLLGVGEDC